MPLPLALRVVAPAARPQLRRLSLAASAVLVQVGLVLLRPWPLALAVDHALGPDAEPWRLPLLGEPSPVTVLALAASATVLLSLALGLLDLLLDRSAEGAAERIGAAVREDLFDRAVTRSLRWHDRTRVGELLSRMSTDVGRLQDAVVATTTTLVPDAVMVLGVLALLTAIDPTLALVGLSVVPVLAVLVVIQRRQVRWAEQIARTSAGRLASATADLLRNVRAVQAFGRYDRARTVYAAHNGAVLRAELDAVEVSARWTPMADVVLSLGTGLVLVVGGWHVLSGDLSVGDVLVALSYLGTLYSPVRGLARLSTVLAKASVGAARIEEVLTCEEEVRERPGAVIAPPVRRGVRLERVRFGYDAGQPVLHDLDLEVRRGETVCLLGPSGSGKSTIAHLLVRLYDVDAGRVLVDGIDVRDCTMASLRSRFALLPQDPWLLDASLAENVAFGHPAATRADVLVAAHLARVHEFARRLPQGYDTPLGEGGVRLSGGQRRRVALARALVRRAPVLVLDEPTASLDQTSADAVVEAIAGTAAANGGQATLIVTHDPRLAAVADRVVELGGPAPTETPTADRVVVPPTGREVTTP